MNRRAIDRKAAIPPSTLRLAGTWATPQEADVIGCRHRTRSGVARAPYPQQTNRSSPTPSARAAATARVSSLPALDRCRGCCRLDWAAMVGTTGRCIRPVVPLRVISWGASAPNQQLGYALADSLRGVLSCLASTPPPGAAGSRARCSAHLCTRIEQISPASRASAVARCGGSCCGAEAEADSARWPVLCLSLILCASRNEKLAL
jgi:hypothetical protein